MQLPLILVLVGTVLLVVGLLQDSGLLLIYLSIGCSLLAGLLWVLATHRPAPVGAAEIDLEPFPIADYDALTVEQRLVELRTTLAEAPPDAG